jgi:ferredoxin
MVLRKPDLAHTARTSAESAMTARPRLRVDMIACEGRGFCAEVLPELITPDDWGYPIIRDAQVPPGLRGEAHEAIRLCPKLALRLDGCSCSDPSGRPGSASR